MRLAPGSAPWLLRHELRLAWRGSGIGRPWLWTWLGGAVWLVFHAAAWLLLDAARSELSYRVFVVVALGIWFTVAFMLAQAITLSVDAFFERGDLDLLLASPLPARTVFLVRGLGIAIGAVAVYAWMTTPFANVGLLTGHPGLIAIYPTLAALGLLDAAAGMALTSVLVRLLGARRARGVAQWIGALIAASFFLLLQLQNLVSPERLRGWLAPLERFAADTGLLDRDSFVWLPFNAMLGRPSALLPLLAAGAVAFPWVVASLSGRFLAGTQETTTTPIGKQAVAGAARFRGGLWHTVLIKEWKLIWRDPQLIARTLLQSLYLLPLALIWLRDGSRQTALAPAIVLLSATLAGGLTWLTVAAEDAPDLLASAPVARGAWRRAKLVAGLAPVWLFAAPLVLFLAVADATAAALFAVCVIGATIAAGSIHLLLPHPGNRRNLRQRSRGNLLGSILEIWTTIAWPALTWCLLNAPLYAALPAAAALAAPVVAWWSGGARRRRLDDA